MQVGGPPIWTFHLGLFGLKTIGPWLSIFPLSFYSTWAKLMQVGGSAFGPITTLLPVV